MMPSTSATHPHFNDRGAVRWYTTLAEGLAAPTDQIVFADDSGGSARVGFGGMSFEGMEEGHLVFYRVRDLRPEEELSPQRGRKMTLEPHMVSSICVDGRQVWPAGSSSSDSISADGRR